jgi:hypothetical protein
VASLATIRRNSHRRIVALRHPLLGNDRFEGKDRYSAHAVKIYDSFSGVRFHFSARAGV